MAKFLLGGAHYSTLYRQVPPVLWGYIPMSDLIIEDIVLGPILSGSASSCNDSSPNEPNTWEMLRCEPQAPRGHSNQDGRPVPTTRLWLMWALARQNVRASSPDPGGSISLPSTHPLQHNPIPFHKIRFNCKAIDCPFQGMDLHPYISLKLYSPPC